MELIDRVRNIRVDSRHGRRSPHKPLLLLVSLGGHLAGRDRLVSFNDIESHLNMLIRRFGLPNSRENAYHPFWHLRNDGLWQIDRPELVRVTAAGHAYISDLRDHGIRGGITQEVIDALQSNPELLWRLVQILLHSYFPPSLHDDVLRDVGLAPDVDLDEVTGSKPGRQGRDPGFRNDVLRAYEGRCAVCELDVWVDDRPVGVEAAHIKWHSAGGPAQVRNGLALCVLHHKFFDSGLFTVMPDLNVQVGGTAEGHSVEELLHRYGGATLRIIPDSPEQRPSRAYLDWHKQAVFKATTAA